MKNILNLGYLAICMALCIATSNAQTVVSSNLLLVDPGSGHMAKLQVPALTGPLTYSLPNSNGTLLITNGSGVSSGWLLGGNDLSSAGPADNKLGTTTTHDLVLIAGSDGRMQLSNATSNVTLLDGTKLSFEEAGGTNFSSFVAGAQTSDINYTLPTTEPAAGQVLTATNVTGPSPFAVTLGWGSSGSAVTVKEVAADATNTSTTVYSTLSDLTTAVSANTDYQFELSFSADAQNNGDEMDLQFTFPSGTITYTVMCLSNNVDYEIATLDASPAVVQDLNTQGTARFWKINGVVKIGATGGNLKLAFKKNAGNATNQVRIFGGAYLSLR